MQQGKLITFEGGDGAGKSTQVQRLYGRMRAAGYDVMLTHEPGGSAGGAPIRKLLLRSSIGERALAGVEYYDQREQLLLHYAARYEHVRTVIAPALRAGRWVLCDRYIDSSRAYQGWHASARCNHMARLFAVLEEALHGVCWPALTIVLRLPPEVALRRIAARVTQSSGSERGGEQELLKLAWHEAIAQEYAHIVRAEPKRCVDIDAHRGIDAVAAEVWRVVSHRLLAAATP